MSGMVVLGAGVVSPVGLSVDETAASVRAGVMRFEESPLMDRGFEPFVLATVPEPALPPLRPELEDRRLTARERRLVRLAQPALEACLASLPEGAGAPPLLLALPETETTRPLDAEGVLDALAVQIGGGEPPGGAGDRPRDGGEGSTGRFDRSASEASRRGRAGGLGVLAGAAGRLAAGAPYVLVGGVDSWRDLYVLGTLDAEGRVKSPRNLDGFIPGEGAGFLLVATPGTADREGLASLARLAPPVEGLEEGHLYSEATYRGDGLASVVARAVAGLDGGGPIREVYSSMNGESHWAKEWGVSFLRSRESFDDDHGMHHPADCYGDPGAAAGPLMVALAATGLRQAYRRSPALVYASSDHGERSAVVVHAP